MSKDIQNLLDRSAVIRDAFSDRENTAKRVGSLLWDMNEFIVDNCIGKGLDINQLQQFLADNHFATQDWVLKQVLGTSDLFDKITVNGVEMIRANYPFWSVGNVAAYGDAASAGGSGSGGGVDLSTINNLLKDYLLISNAAQTYSRIGHSHSFAEITATPTTIAGYGIADAHIKDTTITLGQTSLKVLTSITKDMVEGVLTGNISSHTHSQYLTAHQTIHSLSFAAGAFVAGSYDPATGAALLKVPTSTDHISEGANNKFFTDARAVAALKSVTDALGARIVPFEQMFEFATVAGRKTIKAKFPFWSVENIAAYGEVSAAGSGSSGGVDMNVVQTLLADYLTVKQAAQTYQPKGDYALNSALTAYLSKTEAASTYAPKSHTHAFSALTGTPTTLAGYGITDAKIANGTITLGANSITPLTAITKAMVEGVLTGNITSHTHSQYALASALSGYLPLSGGSMTNTNKVGNLNADLLDGYHESSFVRDRLLFDKADYQHVVILLWKTAEVTTHRLSGQLFTYQGGSARYNVADIDFWYSRWSTGMDNYFKLETFGQSIHFKLVTCNYNGEEWWGLQYTGVQAVQFYFRGTQRSISFTKVHYYTSNTQTVVNAEVNGSIVDRSAKLSTFMVGAAKNALTSDNVASASKLADDTIFTAWGQPFFQNGVPKSVTGALSGVPSIANGEVKLSFAPTFAAFLKGAAALPVYVGGLLVSNLYADGSKIPTYGIYSKGDIHTSGSIKIGEATFSYDYAKGAVKVDKPLYSEGNIAAYGDAASAGGSGSGSGGGVDSSFVQDLLKDYLLISTAAQTYSRIGHEHTYIKYRNERSSNAAPFDASYSLGLEYSLRLSSADSLKDGGDYHGVMSLRQWSDNSGGPMHQLAFTSAGNIHYRYGSTAWSAWKRLAFVSDLADYLTKTDAAANYAAKNHTHPAITSLPDRTTGTATYLNYGAPGLATASWLAAWNGYELRAMSPANVLACINALSRNGGSMANTNLVANMNADLLDGKHAAWFAVFNEGLNGDDVDYNAYSYNRNNLLTVQSIHVNNYKNQKNVPFTGYGQMVTFGGDRCFFPFRIAVSSANQMYLQQAGYKTTEQYDFSGRPWQHLATDSDLRAYLPLSGGSMSNTNLVQNLNADLLDGYHASQFTKGSHVEYTASDATGRRWVRIAQASHYNSYAIITVGHSWNHDPNEFVTFIVSSGYRGNGVYSINQIGGNSHIIRGARIVYPTTANTATYIEIDYAENTVGHNTLYVTLVAGRGYELLTAPTTGSIPANYGTYQQTFCTNGMAAKTFLGALSGNASTATQLQTARKIWGQLFDGSAAVSGALSDVTNITMSGVLKIGDATINYVNGALKVDKPFYSTGNVAAYGEGASGSGSSGSGGVDMNVVQTLLADYLTTEKAAQTYQPKGAYLTPDTVAAYAVTALGISGNDLTWTKNGAVNKITVPYAATASRMKIADVRGAAHAPNYWHGSELAAWFNNTGMPRTDWFSGLTFIGWTPDTYSAWQIAACSGAGADPDKNMYFRVGRGTAWEAWQKVLTDANFAAVLDGRYYTESEIDSKLTGGAVTKVGTATVGASNRPIYLNAGVPTACAYTFGNASGNAALSNGTVCANLNADMLDGYHLRNILERKSTTDIKQAPASKWYRVAKFFNNNGTGVQGIIMIGRSYNSPANESYTYSISLGYSGDINITQLSGQIGGHLITKIRVTCTDSGNAFVDLYCKYGGQYINTLLVTTIGGLLSLDGTAEATELAITKEYATHNGMGNSSGFSGNATTATKLQTARKIWGKDFDGTADVTGALSNVSDIAMSGMLSGVNTIRLSSYFFLTHPKAEGKGFYLSPTENGDLSFSTHTNYSWNKTWLTIARDTGLVSVKGGLQLPYTGGAWITMATRTNQLTAAISNTEANAHSLFCVKSFRGDAVAFGGLGNNIGFYGFTKEDIEANTNRLAWQARWNAQTGNFLMTGTLTAGSFIKDGGTASQFLKADGSVDTNAYALASALGNYLPLAGGTMKNANLVGNLNADLLDGHHGKDYAGAHSYNFPNGFLVKLNATANADRMISVHILGNTFRNDTEPIDTVVQFYNYHSGDSIIGMTAMHNGFDFGAIRVFTYGGYIYLWFQQTRTSQSFVIRAYDTNHDGLISATVTNAAVPASGVTRSKTIIPVKSAVFSETGDLTVPGRVLYLGTTGVWFKYDPTTDTVQCNKTIMSTQNIAAYGG